MCKTFKLSWSLGFVVVIFTGFCFAGNRAYASIFSMFKTKDYQGIIDRYGSSYLTLAYNELIILSEAYKIQKNYDKQIKILKHLDLKKPNYYKIHLAIADASKAKVYEAITAGEDYKMYQQSLSDAVEYYRSAINLNPKDISPYQSLMTMYKDQENVPEGLALTKTMLAQFGETPNIVTDLCEWTSKFGLVAQTQKACLRASELSPSDAKPLVHMALSIRDSGELEKFQTEIFKIYQRFPNSEDVIDLVGAVHIENKDYINAEKALIKNKNSKLESSRINLATAFYENEKFEEALNYFSESCPIVNEERRKLLRYFESRLRRLEINGMDNMAFKFQKELNSCRATPVVITASNKVRSSHFSEGIRLPSNARDLEGKTLLEKRSSYERSKEKKNQIPLKVPAPVPTGDIPE